MVVVFIGAGSKVADSGEESLFQEQASKAAVSGMGCRALGHMEASPTEVGVGRGDLEAIPIGTIIIRQAQGLGFIGGLILGGPGMAIIGLTIPMAFITIQTLSWLQPSHRSI